MNTSTSRNAVGAYIVNSKNEVLFLRRSRTESFGGLYEIPSGGVEAGETLAIALKREVLEETGVVITGEAQLFGLYTHFDVFPGDHIALFCVRVWEQPMVPPPNAEIVDQRFFHWLDLPDDINSKTAKRIAEVFGGAAKSKDW